MAKTQKEMKLRNARPEVDTQAALALARARAGSKSPHVQSSTAKQKAAFAQPQLRVVERPRRLVGFRISNKMFLLYVIGFFALFAAVVMRAEMAATQLRLNALNSQLSSMETQHLRLEIQLSSLESPSRIVSYAETRLGMVYPSQVGYLGAGPSSTANQTQSTALTPQVIAAPSTLFAPPGEAGGGAPTRPLPTGNSSTTATTAAPKATVSKTSSANRTSAPSGASSGTSKFASPSTTSPSSISKSG
ncbi:MAG: hypothetical protein M0Z96_03910 [Actinomycetota bacterium]|nr:hypothetical protein [Actinomycetota bacterium]